MNIDRRSFVKTAASLGVGSVLPFASDMATTAKEVLRIGFLGTGLRGQDHLAAILKRKDCRVVAICDIDPVMLGRTREIIKEHGASLPTIYDQSEEAWKDMLTREDLDAVIISTPWEWHVPMAIGALSEDLYVGLEVGGAFSLDECWELVRAEESSRGKLFFLENVCYRRDVMAIMNMVRDGLFGELIHLQGGYQHDLRAVKFNDGQQPYGGGVEFGEKGFSEARWRTPHSVHRNGELYPTHGLGPVAMMANIHRGNRMTHLTAMASKARGLHDYIVKHPQGGESHPNADVRFALGDVVTTMIHCQNGETILLQHDTSLPQPYSLGFRVQGTGGLWMDVNHSLHLEGRSEPHRWEDAAGWLERYDHPLWKKYAD
ncbi:MAG TPA: Gfo/Idh/MocA family oxidoreductase [Saprospiraceae bacterium]|nr:Gfo/Idh/MocA family oxidoreductase [Saprospiraceae bacterium]